jgi:chloramphenicol 3-O phosphotransferase
MEPMTRPGSIVVLNGAPRAGKSSIASAIQDRFDGPWLNLGVDVFVRSVTPERYRPGIGLRPGGERPDLEPIVAVLFAGLYESVAAHSRLGLNVVVDVGHHDAYSRPLGTLADAARRLDGLPAYLVGVRCPIEEIMRRRDAAPADVYATSAPGGGVPEAVRRWQHEVHVPGVYDLEVDTSVSTPAECAEAIGDRLAAGPPTAFPRVRAQAS